MLQNLTTTMSDIQDTLGGGLVSWRHNPRPPADDLSRRPRTDPLLNSFPLSSVPPLPKLKLHSLDPMDNKLPHSYPSRTNSPKPRHRSMVISTRSASWRTSCESTRPSRWRFQL